MEYRTKFITENDKLKIKKAINLHAPVEVISYTLPREMELYIQEVLTCFLVECHQEHMIDNLIFCLGELLTNSKKANTKRIYFAEQNLDINNEMDYHQGMVSFKEDMLSKLKYYLKKQKDAGLYVKFSIQLYDEGLKIEIRNNSVLTIFEKKRINEKLKVARKYDNPSQAIARFVDLTEGAGLGIIIIVLMLEKIGLPKDSYKVFSTNNETITQMVLPLNKDINEQMDKLYDEFVNNLTTVPVFEESIEEFSKLSKNPDVTDQQLVDYIIKDVFLATAIIKAAAAKGKNCSKITCAYNFLGRDEVCALFDKNNPALRLIKKEPQSLKFWQHEYEVAYYAYNLAKNFPQINYDLEEVFTGALFHDIECLILEVATEEQKNGVKKIADSMEDGEKLYNLFLEDFGHTRGCYMLAKKWGLPDRIAQVIKYHNNPDAVPEEIKDIVYIIYLADVLQYYKNGDLEFYQLNKNVLDHLNINSKEVLDSILEKLSSSQQSV